MVETIALQALLTVPRGPEETVDDWYATARQGIATTAIVTWQFGQAPKVFFYVSRIKDNSPVFTMALLRNFLHERADLSQCKAITAWSGGGTHFRSNEAISTAGVRSVQALCQKSTAVADDAKCCPQVAINHGVPKHFKNERDRLFGACRTMTDPTAKAQEIPNEIDLLPAWLVNYDVYNQMALQSGREVRMVAEFIHLDVNTLEHRQTFCKDFWLHSSRQAFMAPISCCHSWLFRLNDARARNNQLSVDIPHFLEFTLRPHS